MNEAINRLSPNQLFTLALLGLTGHILISYACVKYNQASYIPTRNILD